MKASLVLDFGAILRRLALSFQSRKANYSFWELHTYIYMIIDGIKPFKRFIYD